MRLPRDRSGEELARALEAYGYTITRQSGSHLRLTTQSGAEHHITIPRHAQLRAVLAEIARHFEVAREAVTERLFGR